MSLNEDEIKIIAKAVADELTNREDVPLSIDFEEHAAHHRVVGRLIDMRVEEVLKSWAEDRAYEQAMREEKRRRWAHIKDGVTTWAIIAIILGCLSLVSLYGRQWARGIIHSITGD